MVLELLPKAPNPQSQTFSEEIVLLHTTIKGIQVGLVLGPIIAVLSSIIKKKKLSRNLIGKSLNYGIIGGIGLSDGMTFYKLKTSDKFKNQSRAYRLERSYNQNLIDNLTLGGMLIGQLALGGLVGPTAFLKCNVGGALGFWLGALYLRTI